MKRKLVLLCLGCLTVVILSACKPQIPHPIEGRNDCVACHGQNGVKPYPEDHAKRQRGNDTCLNCHKPADTSRQGVQVMHSTLIGEATPDLARGTS